jgi:hypothetical protein
MVLFLHKSVDHELHKKNINEIQIINFVVGVSGHKKLLITNGIQL